ncbi:MAG: beta-propeller domain-containing protein [Nocardioides sp.]|nr:beta-propeller domain-containing protein [Nocardioides sp.]
MPKRSVTTSVVVTTGLVAALGLGYVAGRGAGDAGGGPPEPRPTAPPVALVNADLVPAGSCDELLESYVDRAVEQVTAWGWVGPVVYAEAATRDLAAAPVPTAGDRAARTSRAQSTETGTNVQEAGVDEADTVKVSPDLLVRLRGSDLVTYDITGDEPVEVSTLELPRLRRSESWRGNAREMLLVGERAVVAIPVDQGEHTRVLTVDLADPAAPEVVDTLEVGDPVSALRLHGDVVRAVVDTGLPDLDFVEPGRGRTRKQAKAHNLRLVRESTVEDWVPSLDGTTVDCSGVAWPDDPDAPLGTTTVVAFDPATPQERTVAGAAVAAATTYFSTDRFYLAAGAPAAGPWGWERPALIDCWGGCFGGDGTTRLYAFELDGTDTTYVASGRVDGRVRDRWSMDVVGGSLRVAVGPTQETGSFNSVVTLREEGSELVEEGRVDRLGPDEEIKSVRWFDDLAIVVTFRQVDPLYAVDLSDPAAPRLLGQLKIPGFSEYLHPLGPFRMIGIGQDATRRGLSRGAQAALFDVGDLTSPRQLDVHAYGRTSQARAALDPRQFTWLPDGRTALTVITRGWGSPTAWVSVLEVRGGRLENRMVEVEHGQTGAEQVRLVPLASGRVALVTSDEVTFFSV